MTVFQFSWPDLLTNRGGHLTRAQCRILRIRRWEYFPGYGLLAVLCGLIYGAMMFDGLQRGNISVASIVIMSVVFITSEVIFISVIKQRWDKVTADVENGVVAHVIGKPIVSGHIRGSFNQSKIGQLPHIRIADMDFDVPEQAVARLDMGEYYCIYYAPNSRLIVSVEKSRGPGS